MHEVGIAQGIIELIERQAQPHGNGRVTVLRLRIGEMSGVEPEALRFALETLGQGTRSEGMKVEISRVPARGHCRACGRDWDFDRRSFHCPTCDSTEIEIGGGHELTVDSFDME